MCVRGWGGGAGDPPLENYKAIGFLNNTGPVLSAGPLSAR